MNSLHVNRRIRVIGVVLAFFLALHSFASRPALAQEVFVTVPLRQLNIVEGKFPPPSTQSAYADWTWNQSHQPYAVLDGDGEVLVGIPTADPNDGLRVPRPMERIEPTVAIRVPLAGEVTGRVVVFDADAKSATMIKFKVNAEASSPAARELFFQIQRAHYEELQRSGAPGTAWFRHRALEARRELGIKEEAANPNQRWRRNNLDDEFDLFTGSRAISENLQLERGIAPTTDDVESVKVEDILGITIAEMNWDAMLTGKAPALDPLATFIPTDQHAIFFPSFESVRAVVELASETQSPLLDLNNLQTQDDRTQAKYERQMCLSVDGLARLLGKTLVRSVAVTSSDPFLPSGTDLAVIFETQDPDTLRGLLSAKIELVRAAQKDVEKIETEVGGVAVVGARSADRGVCVYIARIEDAVVVTNSTQQLAQIIDARRGKTPNLSTAQEYKFFRDRYARGTEDESGFVILTDAAIRKWCSPRWRIADARRTRAAAFLAEMKAASLDKIVAGKLESGMIHRELPMPELGELRMTANGPVSQVYGSSDFLTPISELEIKLVTQAESSSYQRWRNQYQSNWRWAFDPIAAKIVRTGDRLSCDISVMPLIFGTDYRQYIDLVRGAKIELQGADLHGALAHFCLAINSKGDSVRSWGNLARNFAPGIGLEPLAWVGPSVSLYADESDFWKDLDATPRAQRNEFFERNLSRLPIALRVQSNSSLKLTVFLASARAFIEQSAPQMTQWETLEHNGKSYVRIKPTPQAREGNAVAADLAIYYAATADSLVVTLDESLLKRSLDRQVASTQAAPANAPTTSPTSPLLGESMTLQINGPFAYRLSSLWLSESASAAQEQSWRALPILNEWKRRFPSEDPVKLHERIWGSRLQSIGGGNFVWNDKWQSMESVTFGCPAQPKEPDSTISILKPFSHFNAGLNFEDNGLRARFEVKLKP